VCTTVYDIKNQTYLDKEYRFREIFVDMF